MPLPTAGEMCFSSAQRTVAKEDLIPGLKASLNKLHRIEKYVLLDHNTFMLEINL